MYEPRVALQSTTNVSSEYTKITIDLPNHFALSDANLKLVCLFGKDEIPASACTPNFPSGASLDSIDIKTPLTTDFEFDVTDCPILIKLYTIGIENANHGFIIPSGNMGI